MQIMNVTNYSTQKYNRPSFGMVLDFTPETIDKLGKRNFKRLAKEVKDLVTNEDQFALVVRGDYKLGNIRLSTEDGITNVQTSCIADFNNLKAYLRKINDFCRSLT